VFIAQPDIANKAKTMQAKEKNFLTQDFDIYVSNIWQIGYPMSIKTL